MQAARFDRRPGPAPAAQRIERRASKAPAGSSTPSGHKGKGDGRDISGPAPPCTTSRSSKSPRSQKTTQFGASSLVCGSRRPSRSSLCEEPPAPSLARSWERIPWCDCARRACCRSSAPCAIAVCLLTPNCSAISLCEAPLAISMQTAASSSPASAASSTVQCGRLFFRVPRQSQLTFPPILCLPRNVGVNV